MDDVLEFCSDVFADKKQVGSNIVSALSQNNHSSIANIYLDAHTLCVIEVMQDEQEPLKVCRFVLSKGNHFSSTSETLLCHAFTTCFIVLVVPKGNTIEQVCAPRAVYKVLKRIPLRQRSQSSGNVSQSDLRADLASKEAKLKQSDIGVDPPGISYVSRQEVGDDMQAPTVVVDLTATWPAFGEGIGDQKPEPIKTTTVNSEGDSLMQQVDCLALPAASAISSDNKDIKGQNGTGSHNNNGTIQIAEGRVIAAQASPLKKHSKSPDTQTTLIPLIREERQSSVKNFDLSLSGALVPVHVPVFAASLPMVSL